MTEIVVIPESEPAPLPITAPSDLTALVSALVDSNRQLVVKIGEMSGELAVLRERTHVAQETALDAARTAEGAEANANVAANIALDMATQTAIEKEEEEEEEEEIETDNNPEIVEIVDESTPESSTEILVDETPPEPRIERTKRYFV